MRSLDNKIQERLVINSKSKTHSIQPKNTDELKKRIQERLNEDKDADLNDIDVSKITDMTELFYELHPHNINISEWDVSNVTDMRYMFYGCHDFNSDLSQWDVHNVKDMHWMFQYCEKFDCDLENWNISKVDDIENMFSYCSNLKNTPSWYKE